MTKKMRWAWALMAAFLLLAASAVASAQTTEKVYLSLAPAQVEKILTEMAVKFTKEQPPKYPKDWDFNFERNTYRMRLTIGDGKLLWISAYFPKCPLEKINQWNVNAKFSRAVLERVDDREYATVESQIDAGGGITENMIRQFIRRFDNECSSFDQFLRR